MSSLIEPYFIRHFARCVWNEGIPLPIVGAYKFSNKHLYCTLWSAALTCIAAAPLAVTWRFTKSRVATAVAAAPLAAVAHFFGNCSYAAFGIGPSPFGVRALASTPREEGVKYVRFVVISDTHGKHDHLVLPDGDVLLHCGDFTAHGTKDEVAAFNEWLGQKCNKFRRRIVIAGNHELCLDPHLDDLIWEQYVSEDCNNKRVYAAEARALLTNCEYLLDQEAPPECGIRIFGAPWTPTIDLPHVYIPWGFNRDYAAKKQSAVPKPFGNAAKKHDPVLPVSMTATVDTAEARWAEIPDGIDILMTHGPPQGRCDCCWGRTLGDAALREKVERVSPRFHVFGHLHEAYGTCTVGPTTFVNASSCTLLEDAAHRPVVFDVQVKSQ
eukprot:TRINITY_DN75442_c0_g1_i1.p1 TRINITY_DN75442_c0_g1~~TRINITY_DN75442_c0_g1_i1.p1  ORF type:complete len:382 (-),score=45.76 TRINITY_DN75442_c0_g1_i1:99-1244(-)